MDQTQQNLFDLILTFQKQVKELAVEQGEQRVMITRTAEAIDGLNTSVKSLAEAVKGLTDAETARKGRASAFADMIRLGRWLWVAIGGLAALIASNWSRIHDFLAGPRP
ncbi:hypothetical protein L2U69_11765 [Zavarzinia compransoris]|uniref:hypothetical protein n=1 Tax=Zavarzinia marina TaxID=2911065 RepID=UPI001F2D1044|nr:hypothetical protein [Zavarzinia marina]MCF4166323.1 hypothetical protein [Zavarzinia marina]